VSFVRSGLAAGVGVACGLIFFAELAEGFAFCAPPAPFPADAAVPNPGELFCPVLEPFAAPVRLTGAGVLAGDGGTVAGLGDAPGFAGLFAAVGVDPFLSSDPAPVAFGALGTVGAALAPGEAEGAAPGDTAATAGFLAEVSPEFKAGVGVFFGSVAVAAGRFGAVALDGVAAVPSPALLAPGFFVSSGLGTLGRRSERISAARKLLAEPGSGLSSVTLVTTRTSSRRFRSAAGLTLTARNGSLSRSGVTCVTVPTGRPLG
jgi:hypothetical protein